MKQDQLKTTFFSGVFVGIILLALAVIPPWKTLLAGSGKKKGGDPEVELIDPEMAPPEIKPLVMEGYRIMLHTKKLLPEYAGDLVSCSNCHFAGGNTFGGKNGGISLVGVVKKYPHPAKDGGKITIQERINGCFERSMNGKPLPVDSRSMKAMAAFLEWISTPVASWKEPPGWLGLKPLKSDHVPDPEKGRELFALHCAGCHGKDGQGQMRREGLSYPPLWGKESFNDAAGMAKIEMIGPFIYHNMPYQDPFLTVEQALDVGAYVISRPRTNRSL